MKVQTEFTLYRSAEQALKGTPDGAAWAYPGAALSANTTQFYAQMGLTLQFARWVVAWNPDTGSSPTGVRLVLADSGPTNEVEVASFLASNCTTPRVDAADVTRQLQSLAAQKTIAHQTCGNGQNGCKIYGSWVECVWAG